MCQLNFRLHGSCQKIAMFLFGFWNMIEFYELLFFCYFFYNYNEEQTQTNNICLICLIIERASQNHYYYLLLTKLVDDFFVVFKCAAIFLIRLLYRIICYIPRLCVLLCIKNIIMIVSSPGMFIKVVLSYVWRIVTPRLYVFVKSFEIM